MRRLSQQYAYTSIQMHEAIGREAGLPGTDHKYLGFLIQKGEMTAGDLATLTGLTTGAVTGLIDRLERKKLVKRKFAPDDRRKVLIEPDTKKIMALLAPLYKDFRSESQNLLASFTGKETKVLERYFSEAIGIMNVTTSKLNDKRKKKGKQ
ncbi:MAG TPA: helix-turn-helix domain-containing protein [Ohtaekwangia sp.]|nr:helix-turn-helix domain-containing protein [Ohtaekwangia sp.]